jgi:pimeloyl-ACP methyl ester carboxylesterase
MKKLLGLLLVGAILVAGLKLGSHVYRYEFYDWAVATEAKKAGLVEKTEQLDGLGFSYFEAGSADRPTVLMIHGFGASKENWLRFAAPFQPDYRVIALDLAGHGRSDPGLVPGFSAVDQARFVVRVMDRLGIDKAALVGNSMGGAISGLVGALFPQRVTHLILIGPAGFQSIESELDIRIAQGGNPLIVQTPEEFEQLIEFVSSQPPFIPAALKLVQGEKAAARAPLNARIFAALQEDRKNDVGRHMASIQAPTLILWGKEDRAINVANLATWQQHVPHVKTHVFEGIGHIPMIEIPVQSARHALDFLGGH